MNFLIDNNLSPSWARALHELSATQFGGRVEKVRALRDEFPANTPDMTWLTTLGQQGNWAVISSDHFKKSGGAEREVIRRYGINVFVLAKGWSTHLFWQQTAQLILWWPRIVEQTATVAKVSYEVPWRLAGRFSQL